MFGPYTMTWFASKRDTDIEHIVARSEAHDSGLCAAEGDVRERFARDRLNLTLASPSVNRHQKSDKDAAEWLPDHNQCWFAGRVIQVRQKYELTIDRVEANTLDSVLGGCASMDLVISSKPAELAPSRTPVSNPAPSSGDALALYDDNGNGRITCAEARAHGIDPVPKDHPAYRYMDDRDGDGVVCE